MILGGHCFLYVGAAWPAPLCRLFVHKVRAGEPGQTIARAELLPTHTMARRDEGPRFWGLWRGWGAAFPERGGAAVGTRAHPHWDHVAEQLDFFHG